MLTWNWSQLIWSQISAHGDRRKFIIIFNVITFPLENGEFRLPVIGSERIDFILLKEVIDRSFLFSVLGHISYHLHVLLLYTDILVVTYFPIRVD